MYLSRLTLNVRNRQVQKELANCYEFHRTLMSAFPAALPPGERVLYRLETDARSALAMVLVQSASLPDWSALPAGYSLKAPECKPFAPLLQAGQVLRFRLLANPTRKTKRPPKEGQEPEPWRVGLLKDEEQQAWLQRKAADHGFALNSVQMAAHPDVTGFTYQGETRRRITFQAVLFDGVLTIRDAQALASAVQNGIGSGKGFGFGLLSLARPA